MPRKNKANKEEQLKKIEEAVEVAKERGLTTIPLKDIVANDDISALIGNILDLSGMTTAQKAFFKAIFLEKKDQRQALKKAIGTDPGYQTEVFREGLMRHKAVKEFMEMMKLFYIRVAPIAQLKEVELLLTSKDDDTVLKAAKDIQDRANLGAEGQKASLPVQVIINMPGQPQAQPIEGETVQEAK